MPLSLQLLLAGVQLRVSRSCPTAGGRRVSLPRHRCEELANIVPLSAGVASGAGIFKPLWRPGIDAKALIPPAYVAWRAGTITLFLLSASPP